ncbi:hypothetical protein [Halobacterium noricense]|uniref:hypothetical protein n=1 Tax=Halobacterium noricense TaxID=223182 RepID=UPI001E3B894F|nr:hypothetical protein [Halobacterium noricense]UHH24570.1 hypothetical protein LT974_11315 [Halobacterium noricense]
MSDYSPPSLPRSWTVVIVAFLVAVFAYSVLIAHQPLLGLLPALVVGVGYFAWRLLAALEAIAGRD